MKRIAIIFLGLLLSTCGAESPTSPQAVAGIYTLQAVKIDTGIGRAQVYRNHEAEENPPTGFIELNPDRTYRLFANFGSPDQSITAREKKCAWSELFAFWGRRSGF